MRYVETERDLLTTGSLLHNMLRSAYTDKMDNDINIMYVEITFILNMYSLYSSHMIDNVQG